MGKADALMTDALSKKMGIEDAIPLALGSIIQP